MNALRHCLTHWITSAAGLAIAFAQFYVATTPQGKYAALLSAILGLVAKDPNRH